jgi:hypothetical protein
VLDEVLTANRTYAADFGDKGKLAMPAQRFAILTSAPSLRRSAQPVHILIFTFDRVQTGAALLEDLDQLPNTFQCRAGGFIGGAIEIPVQGFHEVINGLLDARAFERCVGERGSKVGYCRHRTPPWYRE